MSISLNEAGRSTDEMSATRRRGWLTAVLVGGFALRVFRLDWGLPEFVFNDTKLHFVEAAQRAVAVGDWTFERFVHPPFYPYIVAISTSIWATVTGREIALFGPVAAQDQAAIVLVGRAVTVVVATALIGATYLLGRRLMGVRAGLWAAAFLALSPLQIIESHRINVDTPMLLIAVLAAHQAVVAYQDIRRRNLLFSFALAALAGATKYTGLYAGTLPIWVALRWPGVSWERRLRLVVEGGLASLVTFAAALSPVLLNWEVFVSNLHTVVSIGAFYGAPGQDLVGDSWVFAPYLYLSLVGLPFVLGWAIYAAAIAGLLVMAVRNRPALALLAAGALPFFLLQGAAETTTARYYFPLLPFLVVSAGAFVVWLRSALPRTGNIVAAIIFAYSAILACSQDARIGGAPQAATAELLEHLAEAKRSSGISLRAIDQPKLVVGYPSAVALSYDALSPRIRTGPTRNLVFLPNSLRTPGEAIDAEEALREDRRWVDRNGVDVVIVPSRWKNLKPRKSMKPREEQYYDGLVAGRLGLRQVREEETTYFTQSWYEWADPTLDTVWTAGIGGYTLFVRDDLLAALATLESNPPPSRGREGANP